MNNLSVQNIMEDIMEDIEAEMIVNMFSVPKEWAEEAIEWSGGELKKIREYLKRKSRRAQIKPTKCILCGKKLTDPDSIARGYGEECYKKIQNKDKYGFWGGE